MKRLILFLLILCAGVWAQPPTGTKVWIPDDGDVTWGTDGDIRARYDETTDNRLEVHDGTNLLMYLSDGGSVGDGGVTGDWTVGDLLTTKASASGGAGLNLPHGTAPSAPNNGDVWTTTAGMYVRINGATIGPLGASGQITGPGGGSTDNALMRWNGTGGDTAQDSNVTLSDDDTLITVASDTTAAGLRLPHGAAPSSPTNGDIWTTTSGLYMRINGATVGPIATGSGDVTAAAVVADNAVLRGDGGAKGVQTSDVYIEDDGDLVFDTNDAYIYMRNAADSADLQVLGLTSSNNVLLNAESGDVYLRRQTFDVARTNANGFLVMSPWDLQLGQGSYTTSLAVDTLTANRTITVPNLSGVMSLLGPDIGVSEISATGTASATTFLRGDGAWATPAGSGSVVGPGSSTDNAIARYNGTGGDTIQDSGVTIDDSSNMAVPGNLTVTVGRLSADNEVTIASDDADPSVAATNTLLVTNVAWSGSNLLDNLDDGVEGQIVTFLCTIAPDGDFGVDDGTGNLELAGDWTPGLYDTLTVQYYNGKWYELSRSNN